VRNPKEKEGRWKNLKKNKKAWGVEFNPRFLGFMFADKRY
jgi:hypothetical protein